VPLDHQAERLDVGGQKSPPGVTRSRSWTCGNAGRSGENGRYRLGVSTHPSSRSASGNRAPSGNSSRPRPVHAERPFNRENQIDEVESVRAEAVDEPRLEGNLGFIEGKAVGDHRQCYTEGVGGRFCCSPLDAAKVLP
jgi:hypothetical protein